MGTFVAVFLAVGFLIGFALFGWLALSSVRRHGFRNAFRGAARTYAEELPLYWRVPMAGSMFVIALPLIAVLAIVKGDWDPVGAIPRESALADLLDAAPVALPSEGSGARDLSPSGRRVTFPNAAPAERRLVCA